MISPLVTIISIPLVAFVVNVVLLKSNQTRLNELKMEIDPHQNWHKCRECNFKNKLATNLKYHMNCHTRNYRVKCPLCSFSGKSNFYVARHLKLHHLNLADAMPSHPEYLQVACFFKWLILGRCIIPSVII